MTEGLKERIEQFKKSRSTRFAPHELVEFKKFCQDTFRFSIDVGCRDCVCEYLDKTIVYLEKEAK